VTRPRLIAQNLNASDGAVAAAIAAGDGPWIRSVVRRIEDAGLDAIDLNAGTFGDAEATLLRWLVEQVEPLTPLTLSLDSARPEVLGAVARGTGRPVILNALALDTPWSDDLEALLVEGECEAVLSLRRGHELPASAEDRWAWATEGLARLEAKAVDPGRVLVDAIALPWGDDVEAGRGMLDFVERWSARGSGAGALVGLGNLGHGRADAVRINREWLARLRNAGLAAALVDAFEPGLRDTDPVP
jgi:5-methyltetrahydrofolate--homocysteine methyltransferase